MKGNVETGFGRNPSRRSSEQFARQANSLPRRPLLSSFLRRHGRGLIDAVVGSAAFLTLAKFAASNQENVWQFLR